MKCVVWWCVVCVVVSWVCGGIVGVWRVVCGVAWCVVWFEVVCGLLCAVWYDVLCGL